MSLNVSLLSTCINYPCAPARLPKKGTKMSPREILDRQQNTRYGSPAARPAAPVMPDRRRSNVIPNLLAKTPATASTAATTAPTPPTQATPTPSAPGIRKGSVIAELLAWLSIRTTLAHDGIGTPIATLYADYVAFMADRTAHTATALVFAEMLTAIGYEHVVVKRLRNRLLLLK